MITRKYFAKIQVIDRNYDVAVRDITMVVKVRSWLPPSDIEGIVREKVMSKDSLVVDLSNYRIQVEFISKL